MSKTFHALTLDILQKAIANSAVAIRAKVEYQPSAGMGTKVFPPTYEGGKYAGEGKKVEFYEDGKDRKGTVVGYDRMLLDSVQAQANGMEEALLDAWRQGLISLPVITVDFSGNGLLKNLSITSLDAPHRIADALLRDSLLDGVKFRASEVGKSLDNVDARNATALFQYCPTALLLGLWDSTGPKGGMGIKFARALVSEMVAYDVSLGVKTSSRLDPAEIKLAAGPVFQTKDGDWTLNEKEALHEKGKPVKVGKDGKPSETNHGNVTPSITDGGVVFERAEQTVVLSLTALRRLSFPINGAKPDPKVDVAARTLLAALGLCAATLAREQNSDLRSRCLLHATTAAEWKILDEPGEPETSYSLNRQQAIELFNAALEAAKAAKLPWEESEVMLKPSPQLVELVRRSQNLAAKQTLETEA